MSVTGRKRKDGTVYERSKHDFYQTPPRCVESFFATPEGDELRERGCKWIEPCAGNGAIIRTVTTLGHKPNWIAAEIRPESIPRLCFTPEIKYIVSGDFLQAPTPTNQISLFDVAMTNPPF